MSIANRTKFSSAIQSRTVRARRFAPVEPTAVSLRGLKSDRSLWGFQNSQLGVDVASRLKSDGAPIPVKITRCEPGIAEVAPGGARIGVMALELPPANADAKKAQPTVLQIRVPGRSLGKSDRHSGAVVFLGATPMETRVPDSRRNVRASAVDDSSTRRHRISARRERRCAPTAEPVRAGK